MISRKRIEFVVLLALGLAASGCAHEPAFTVGLPRSLDLDGRALAVIGDLQQTSRIARFVRGRENNDAAQQRLVADLQDRAADFGALVVVGDLVFSARSDRSWDHFDSLIAPIAERVPVLPAIGNHDYPCRFVELCSTKSIARGMQDRFPWFVPGEPYAVESGDLILLFLDTETNFAEQGLWLRDRLEAAAGAYTAALVFFHRPAWSNSIDRGAVGDPEVQRHFVPHLVASPLPVVVFSGHIHGFEYIVRDGVHYLTTAGGGGPRGPLADERPFDRYRGPDCPQPDGEVFRPFNYLLLSELPGRLAIEVRGFCKGDPGVGVLDSIEIPL